MFIMCMLYSCCFWVCFSLKFCISLILGYLSKASLQKIPQNETCRKTRHFDKSSSVKATKNQKCKQMSKFGPRLWYSHTALVLRGTTPARAGHAGWASLGPLFSCVSRWPFWLKVLVLHPPCLCVCATWPSSLVSCLAHLRCLVFVLSPYASRLTTAFSRRSRVWMTQSEAESSWSRLRSC